MSDPTPEPATAAAVEVPRGQLVAVFAAKGGCGATLLAVNLATLLAQQGRTCLVDLDFCKGDVAGALDLRAGRTINLLLERVQALDDALLHGAVEVLPGGLHVLSQPYDLTDLRAPVLEEVRAALDLVRGAYARVVVDVGSRIDVAALTAAKLADRVLVVATPDVLGLRDAHRVLGLLRRLDVAEDRVLLVVNKAGKGRIPDEEIAAQLDVPVALDVALDPAPCAAAEAVGRPVVDEAPHAPVARDLERLAALVRGEPLPEAAHGRFAWLRGT